MYEYDIVIDCINNNSLGSCWLVKLESSSTGELYDKCLYPCSDYTGRESVLFFIESKSLSFDAIDSIYSVDDGGDVELAQSIAMFRNERSF